MSVMAELAELISHFSQNLFIFPNWNIGLDFKIYSNFVILIIESKIKASVNHLLLWTI